MLALIAVILLATALSLRARLRAQRERRPGAKGVDPLMAARAVVFGQASALVAALVAGMYGGTGVFLLGSLDVPARRDQAIYAGLAVLAGIGGDSRRPLPGAGLQAPGRQGRRQERRLRLTRRARRHTGTAHGGFGTRDRPGQRAMIRLIASARVAGSRSWPRTAEVRVFAPGLRIPRIDMHMCSHSTTTITPRGSRIFISESAICVVSRSCTCGRRA